MPTPRNRRLLHRVTTAVLLTSAVLLISLAGGVSTHTLSLAHAATPVDGGGASSTGSSLPVPASAKAQDGLDASSAAIPSSASGANAATTRSAATPTTTYVPSGGAAPPAGTSSTAASTTASTPTAGIPPATSTTAVITRTPAGTSTDRGDRGLATSAILIAALAALLILACAAWALARYCAFEPRWLLSLRHAMAEAGFRASATWSEFTDWARLGH